MEENQQSRAEKREAIGDIFYQDGIAFDNFFLSNFMNRETICSTMKEAITGLSHLLHSHLVIN